jgi:cation diffusion facilitator family transporter
MGSDSMFNWLIKRFILNYQQVKDPMVRERYGSLSSYIGMVCNLSLFGIKFIMGSLSNSIAITSDAFNNLSDLTSNFVGLLGYKLAAKPADEDHPFGHGRIEYLVSMFIALAIMYVGIQLLTTSWQRILHPQSMVFHWLVVIALLVSILVKLMMYLLNMEFGRRITSDALKATAKDSISDVLATSVTLLALVISPFTDLPVDGIMGVVVALMILYSGYGIIKQTLDTVIGRKVDQTTIDEIMNIIQQQKCVIGVHDLLVHNYGPGRMFASVHCEIAASSDILVAHDQIDNIERMVFEQLLIRLVVHMDPIETDNQKLNEMKAYIDGVISGIDSHLTYHDLRMVQGETHTNIIFDVVIPYNLKLAPKLIKQQIDDKIHQTHPNYFTVITFDNE